MIMKVNMNILLWFHQFIYGSTLTTKKIDIN